MTTCVCVVAGHQWLMCCPCACPFVGLLCWPTCPCNTILWASIRSVACFFSPSFSLTLQCQRSFPSFNLAIQIAKVGTTPTVVIIETLFFGKTFSTKTKLALLPVCLGVILTSATDIQVNFIGKATTIILQISMWVLARCGRKRYILPNGHSRF